MLHGFKNKKDGTKRKGFFLKNGAAVLEQIILDFNGNCNPIRTYSAEELKKATDNFDRSRILFQGSFYSLYKGVHEDREISVKIFGPNSHEFWGHLKWIANEVAIASRMSKHKSVLKLLGCCLETELPILVYEFPVKGNLQDYTNKDNGSKQLPFETKLGIAVELANSVAYLHHGLSKTFIHRDLHPGHVFLGHDYVAKLTGFEYSIPIPEGKTHVDADTCGSMGFLKPPEVVILGRYTERSDVYSFGILLCELLIGKRLSPWDSFSYEEGSSNSEEEIGNIWDVLTNFLKRQLKAYILQGGNRAQEIECAKLIERCLKTDAADRPNMIEVAKALILLKSIQC